MKKIKLFLALLSLAVLIYGAAQTESARKGIQSANTDKLQKNQDVETSYSVRIITSEQQNVENRSM